MLEEIDGRVMDLRYFKLMIVGLQQMQLPVQHKHQLQTQHLHQQEHHHQHRHQQEHQLKLQQLHLLLVFHILLDIIQIMEGEVMVDIQHH